MNSNQSEVERALSCRDIERSILSMFNPFDHVVVPNAYVENTGGRGWEADVLVVRRSMWVEEFEIKVTYSDFKADLKKPKHVWLTKGVASRKSKPGIGYYDDWDNVRPTLVSKFWYVAPEELANRIVAESPDFVGVVAVNQNRYARVLREATRLPVCRKATHEDLSTILKKVYSKWWRDRIKAAREDQPASVLDGEDGQ